MLNEFQDRGRAESLRIYCLALIILLFPWPHLLAVEAVNLGAEDDWYPHTAVKDGKPEGLSVDVIIAAYKAVNVPVNLMVVPFKRGMVLTEKGKFDGVFNGSLHEPSLKKSYQRPRNAISQSIQVVFANKEAPKFNGISDFKNRRVGTTLGYIYPDAITNDPDITIDVSAKDINNLRRLVTNRIDFVIIDSLVAKFLIATYQGELAGKIEIKGNIDPVDNVILFNKTARASRFMADFDRGMDIIKENGTYTRILKSWGEKF